MFTGIVATVGEITDIRDTTGGRRLRIATELAGDLDDGSSISVDGACLTVEEHGSEWFEAFLATETLEKTTIGARAVGDGVNLEAAMPANGRFDGHLVQGHVDTTTQITGIHEIGDDWEYEFALPPDYARYIVSKGSIAIDGISLTVAARDSETFRIAIVPTTYQETTLSRKTVGDSVNVEIDVIAKYVEQLC